MMSFEAKIKRLIAGNKIRYDTPESPRRFNMQTNIEFEEELERYLGPDHLMILPPPPPQLYQHIMNFNIEVPKHCPYLYPQHCEAFTGRAAKQTLTKIVGSDADYLANFLFQHKIVRKIGFGHVDGIIPDHTLYRLDYKNYTLHKREIRNGRFPEETAYFERRAAESRVVQKQTTH